MMWLTMQKENLQWEQEKPHDNMSTNLHIVTEGKWHLFWKHKSAETGISYNNV